jgi:hypothetical protein
MIKVLFVAANPFFEQYDVEFDEELYVVRRALKDAQFRDRFDLIEAVAVEFGELDSQISIHRPDVVHLTVPALPDVGLFFQELDKLVPRPTPEDAYRIPTSATAGAMIETFRPFANFLKCAVYNTPLSPSAAKRLSAYAGTVIGWPDLVLSDKCLAFAEGFYSVLGSGANLRSAFLAGRRRAELIPLPDNLAQSFPAIEPYRVVDEYRELPELDVSTTLPRENLQRPPLRALFLAAVPTLRRHHETHNLAKEVRSIQEKLRRGPLRERSELRVEWAVRVHDLQEHLLEHDPVVLIISGHAGIDGPVMKARDGKPTIVSADVLCGAVKVAGCSVKCVILNGCKTIEIARAIAKEVGFAVGMSDSIPDPVVTVFAEGFFTGISYGKSVAEAHKMGLQSILEDNYNGQARLWMQMPELVIGPNAADTERLLSG